jgi:3-dehydroquinate dehydratase/shikimate dehydrogenase
VALGLPTAAQLSRAAEREYKDGNTFLEFRLDYLLDPASGVEALVAIRKAYPDVHVLATCRHKQNNGRFAGSIEKQCGLLEAAAKAGATAIDLEIESAEQAKSALPALRASAPLILSYHNFKSTPALGPILRRLERVSGDAYKIATTACKPADNERVFDFVRGYRGAPLIAFAMSETGLATRILTPAFGCAFGYAAPLDQEGTAPGQVSAKQMRLLYRCEKLNKDTRVYGVVADPVSHSKSPLIHNRAFQARRIDAVYLPFLVSPRHLSEWFKLAGHLPVSGFSVTIPHKQRIIRHLDIVEPLAKRIGAVNTVWRKGGKWRGTNTDAEGVTTPLARHLRLAHASVLIAGYGGAARAAAIALADAGAKVTITGRDLKGAHALARVVKSEAVTLQDAQAEHYDVLIHATPVGMSPQVDGCLFDGNIPADMVLDMVYNPHETVLLKRAAEQGCTIVYGAEMLLEQAARQFEIWTGESAPRSVMQTALEQHA